MAYNLYESKFEDPCEDEGFAEVVAVKFSVEDEDLCSMKRKMMAEQFGLFL